MDKDDAFIKELQVNDKVKVTVNFFGQEMPFDGTCTEKTNDRISIQTSAKPEPVNFPLSEIVRGEIKERYSSPEKPTAKITNEDDEIPDDYYKYLTSNSPDYCGYIITIYKNFSHTDEHYSENKHPQPSFDIDSTPTNIQLNDTDIAIIINQLYNFTTSSFFSVFYNNDIFSKIITALKSHKKTNTTDNDFCNEIFKSINNEFIGRILNNLQEQYDSIIDIAKQLAGRIDDLANIDYNHKNIIEHLLQIPFYLSTSILNAEKLLRDHRYLNIIDPNTIKLLVTSIDLLYKHVFLLSEFTTRTYSLNSNGLYDTYHDYTSDFARFSNKIYLMNKIIKIYNDFTFNTLAIIPEFEYKSNNHSLRIRCEFLFDFQNEMKLYYDLWGVSLLFSTKHEKYLQSHSLTAITSQWIKQPRKNLIRFLYQNFIFRRNKSISQYYVKITNKHLDKKIKILIKDSFLITETEYSAAILKLSNIFESTYKDTFYKLFLLNNIITIYKHNFIKIHDYICNTVNYLNNNSYRYLIISPQYRNCLSDFFSRLLYSTITDHSIRFKEAENKLLINAEYYNNILNPIDEEPFSTEAHEYIKQLNIWSHTKEFSEIFYQQYIPALEISVFTEAISINPDLHRIYVPLEITNSAKGQNAVIMKCDTGSSFNRNPSEISVHLLEILPGNHTTMLAEFSYNNLNEVLSGFDIDITIQYKFKTAWDFEKCEATWETREISESFSIQDELNHEQLAEFHEIRNLFRDYSSGSVIKDDRMFFGRDQDIKHVIENIRDETGRIITNRCVCIYGQTRTGKSSLLYHIKKRLRSSPSNIIVDIGDLGSAGASEAGIKYRILSSLLEEIEIEHDDICALLSDSGISMTADPERNKTDESYFTEQIGKIRSILRRKAKDTQIIILIDEFTYIYDWIKEKKLSENFMKFWKAFITNYDICAIIVGQDHMMKFINDQRFTNAFGAIRTWEVNYLKEPDACKLVTMPVSDSPDYAGENGCTILPEAVNLLVEMTSGSAYLLMNICADFIDYLNERHALTATRGHAEDFLRRNLSKFEERWFEPLFNDKSDLDSDASITANKELLKKLALSYSEHSGVLPDELSLTEEEKERLQSLEARRVVEMKDGHWRITVRLYAEWLRNKFGRK